MREDWSLDGFGMARFSDDGLHRYQLRRHLNGIRYSWTSCVFVMLNPSTADAFKVDPTVRRCVEFTKRWGFDALTVVNLFSFRSPHPKVLKAQPAASRGADSINDAHILAACANGERVICAWGNGGVLDGRYAAVRELLASNGVELMHLGLTMHGHPKHPLGRGKGWIPDNTQPTVWA